MKDKEKLIDLYENVKAYINLQIRILSLTLGEKVARTIAAIASNTLTVFLFAMFLLFASIALAYGLGQFLGVAWGFLTVAGIYLLAAVLTIMLRKRIEIPLINTFIKLFFKNGDETDNA